MLHIITKDSNSEGLYKWIALPRRLELGWLAGSLGEEDDIPLTLQKLEGFLRRLARAGFLV